MINVAAQYLDFHITVPNTTESSFPVQPDVAQSFKQVVAQKRFL